METIKTMATVFCAGAVAAGIASMLLPSGKLEKVMRVLLGFFLLAVTLSPFMHKESVRWDMPAAAETALDTDSPTALAETVAGQEQAAAGRVIRGQIQEALEGLDIFDAEVDLDMDIDGESCISIRQIKIFLPAGCVYAAADIQKSLRQTLGIEAEVF
ncbi:MAG: hypothetical protein HFE86_04175 [Clostridiales bacterium]|nr:hypothetical protein [Clostridiales bacterium]